MGQKFRINPISAFFHLVRNDVHKLEYDPRAQFEFHRRMSFFWIFNAGAAVIVYVFFGGVWAKLSVLYLILLSLYANFATDYGAMPGAHAAIRSDEIQLAGQQSNKATVAPVANAAAVELPEADF